MDMEGKERVKPLMQAARLSLIMIIFTLSAQAQVTPGTPSTAFRSDYSYTELQSSHDANEKVLNLQIEGEKNMMNAIEAEGLTLERFNEILEEQRDPLRGTETHAAELASFNTAAQAILEEKIGRAHV